MWSLRPAHSLFFPPRCSLLSTHLLRSGIQLLCLSPGAVSSPLAGVSASNQPNPALYMAALMAAAAARQQQTTPTGTSTFSDNLAVSIASMSADRAAHAAASAVNQVNSPGGGGGQVAGRKREAISGDAAASGDGYGVWPPPKRANTMPNGISDGRSSVKTNGGEATDATASEAGATTSLGETGSIPAGGTYTVANSTSGAFVGGGVNYAGIYNMATSAAPGPMSPSSLAAYTSTTDPTNSLANALAFNSILQQQQQAQQQHLAAAAAGGVGALNHLGGGVPPTAAGATNALTLAQQLQQQQVCMALLRLQQQNQLAAMAAAGAGGAYQTAALTQSHPLFSNFAYSAGLSDPLSLQSSAPGLSANAYALQNQPILTNVAYINDEGQLLESLPVCRDFKAGKCHRNADCRYVHLIDVNQGRVTVCRDAAKGRCTRVPCKYYHIPLFAISASRSLALNSALAAAAAAGGVNSAGVTGSTNL
ncbi:unnamed protein product [Schistocephalus solidus]|uniref:C3H1-type domain-containing protein n=1 Tax=Schistocephalus solidus TaxID=70667 RepID=A0A183SYD0_SCHSO|nr:unnamed protein product [Schistocephalus solidus]